MTSEDVFRLLQIFLHNAPRKKSHVFDLKKKKKACLFLLIMTIFLSCQNNLLTEAFGSDKKKRALASRLKNKVDKVGEKVADVVDAISSETLDETGLKKK